VLIVDSNVWFDAADTDSTHHHACAQLLRDHRDELATPAVVIGEAARLIRYKLGPTAEARYLRLVTSPSVEILDLTADDWTRVVELVETYLDRPLGVIDAAIVALAERHQITELASMNGRDFYLVRPRHTPAFTLLPAGLARP
jgi:predicted nucleic acid-binding protein